MQIARASVTEYLHSGLPEYIYTQVCKLILLFVKKFVENKVCADLREKKFVLILGF